MRRIHLKPHATAGFAVIARVRRRPRERDRKTVTRDRARDVVVAANLPERRREGILRR
jgi:hypothetical protein